jgi:hypothetical protein
MSQYNIQHITAYFMDLLICVHTIENTSTNLEFNFILHSMMKGGQTVAELVDALCYKPEVVGFIPDVTGFSN